MPTSKQRLSEVSKAFFKAFSSSAPPTEMLGYFSTTTPVVLQHAPSMCPHPQTSRLVGSNVIRSYFDLLATHWVRSGGVLRNPPDVEENGRVVLAASITWTWRKSGKKWTEDFTWTLDYDEALKIVSFVIRTVSGPGTCVMRAVDLDPALNGVQVSMPLQASMYCSH